MKRSADAFNATAFSKEMPKPRCECNFEYVGSFVWSHQTERFEGQCTSKNPCPPGFSGAQIAAGRAEAPPAPSGGGARDTGGYAPSSVAVQIKGACWLVACPSAASRSTASSLCDCAGSSASGHLVWDHAAGAYRGSCMKRLPCPAHAEQRSVRVGATARPGCVCADGYAGGGSLWDLGGQWRWHGACRLVPCPEGAAAIRASPGLACECPKGFNASSFSWSRTRGAYLGQCAPIQMKDYTAATCRRFISGTKQLATFEAHVAGIEPTKLNMHQWTLLSEAIAVDLARAAAVPTCTVGDALGEGTRSHVSLASGRSPEDTAEATLVVQALIMVPGYRDANEIVDALGGKEARRRIAMSVAKVMPLDGGRRRAVEISVGLSAITGTTTPFGVPPDWPLPEPGGVASVGGWVGQCVFAGCLVAVVATFVVIILAKLRGVASATQHDHVFEVPETSHLLSDDSDNSPTH